MTRLPEFTTDLTAFYSEQTPNGYDFSIAMPYLPELSVNRYKHFGTPFTKKIVRDWMETLGDLLMVLGGQLGIYWPEYKITVRIDGTFKDNRSTPDLSNLMKITADSIQKATGINDKFYATETGTPEIGEPKLIITVKAERK